MTACNFGPAAPAESTVFGACRPGYHTADPNAHVDQWIERMRHDGVERVCCLLDGKLDRYDGLLARYEDAFGSTRVRHTPIADYRVVSAQTLHGSILPFLREADRSGEPVVVHCSAGVGRTGHVHALWLAIERDYPVEEAVETVRRMGRAPLEAASRDDLRRLSAIRG